MKLGFLATIPGFGSSEYPDISVEMQSFGGHGRPGLFFFPLYLRCTFSVILPGATSASVHFICATYPYQLLAFVANDKRTILPYFILYQRTISTLFGFHFVEARYHLLLHRFSINIFLFKPTVLSLNGLRFDFGLFVLCYSSAWDNPRHFLGEQLTSTSVLAATSILLFLVAVLARGFLTVARFLVTRPS